MSQAWVVVEEHGDYSDYRMELISVHDCKESADETCAALTQVVEAKKEAARDLLRKAWELSGRKVPNDGQAPHKLWWVMEGCPEEFVNEVSELYNAAIKENPSEEPIYSVQGPFEVVPWIKPGKLIQD